MDRRGILRGAIVSGLAAQIPIPSWSQQISTPALKTAKVPNGIDRLNEEHHIGVATTAFKVLALETGGNLFMMEHTNQTKGGPARHLHYDQEEHWHVLEGKYIVEIGDERFELGPGDSILGPRRVPHAFAFVGDGTGRLLITFSPAGRMEENFRATSQRGGATTDPFDPKQVQRAREYGMETIGPGIKIPG